MTWPLSAQSLLDGLSGVCYVCDRGAVVRAVGRSNWASMATRNGNSELARVEAIVGRSLFDFIEGHDVRAWYRSRLESLASGDTDQSVFVYRCDAPEMRRDIRMSITRLGAHEGFLFQNLTISESVRPPVDLFDFAAVMGLIRHGQELPLVAMCSFCQRVANSGGDDETRNWVEAEEYYRLGGQSRVRISHGVCSDCYASSVDDD